VPIPERSDAERGVIVAAWLDGTPGMVRLGEPDGAWAVGRAAGATWLRLADVKPAGLDLDDLWARPSALAAAAREWLSIAREDLGPAHTLAAARHLDDLGASKPDRAPRLVHGDLVPANLLLREGRPAVVLDLETVRLGDPLFDAAWFSWIVRYHHPTVWPQAWCAFAESAGLSDLDDAGQVALVALPMARILEIVADPGLERPARDRWLAQLRALTEIEAGSR
jgi:aminoglycoside phosphotransferase (APT) family kinase protein